MSCRPLPQQEKGPPRQVFSRHGTGLTFDSSAGYNLPDGAIRGPDASWVRRERLDMFTNRAQLGWLIDPYETPVYVYRPGKEVECLENPETINGDPVLPGFVFKVSEIL